MCEHLAVSCGLEVRSQRWQKQGRFFQLRKRQFSGRRSHILIITLMTRCCICNFKKLKWLDQSGLSLQGCVKFKGTLLCFLFNIFETGFFFL